MHKIAACNSFFLVFHILFCNCETATRILRVCISKFELHLLICRFHDPAILKIRNSNFRFQKYAMSTHQIQKELHKTLCPQTKRVHPSQVSHYATHSWLKPMACPREKLSQEQTETKLWNWSCQPGALQAWPQRMIQCKNQEQTQGRLPRPLVRLTAASLGWRSAIKSIESFIIILFAQDSFPLAGERYSDNHTGIEQNQNSKGTIRYLYSTLLVSVL